MALQLVKPISLSDVRAEFGAPQNTSLGQFVRGGAFVPDSQANSGVPTSKPIALSNLLGAANSELFIMVAGLAQTQNTGYDTGVQFDDPIGTLTPAFIKGEEVQKCRRNNSGFDIVIHQNGVGDLGGRTFWTSIEFSGPGVWNGHKVFQTEANFADNTNFASWTGMPAPGAFINGLTYELDWEFPP